MFKSHQLAWITLLAIFAVALIQRGRLDFAAPYTVQILAVALASCSVLVTQVGRTGPAEWAVVIAGWVIAIVMVWPDGLQEIITAVERLGQDGRR